MARKENKTAEEAPQSVGEWIVTFSDCMTLLLCFFVLLLTFSSFDEASLKRFGGAFDFDYQDSLIADTKQMRNSMIEPIVHLQDNARNGSDTPTDNELADPGNSRKAESAWILEDDAYRDRKVIRIASARLFEPARNELSTRGKRYLAMIAGFVRKQPCRVIISESPAIAAIGRPSRRIRTGLARAWAVVDYLTRVQRLPREQFNVSATHLADAAKARRGASVEVVLLASKVYE